MKNLISNVLGINSFVILNKAVIKALGMHEAVALGFLIDKWAYFQHEDFYYTIQDLSSDTDLSDRECRNIMRKLMDKGILIKRAFEGIPPKQYYNINQNAIIDILKNSMPKKEKPTLENPTKDLTLADSNPFRNDTFNPCKNDRVNPCKSDMDIYINNKVSNNKDINNTEKEKIKKEKDQAQKDFCPKGHSVFSHALENDFSESENISLFKPETSQKSILELEVIQRELERLKIENNALKSQISENKENYTQEKESELKDEFSQIWDLYPNKQGKQIAFNAYKKARNGNKKQGLAPVSFEVILRGLKNYINANKGVEIKYIKHLSTFLNQQTFMDFQIENNLNRRVGVVDSHADYMETDKSKYIPK